MDESTGGKAFSGGEAQAPDHRSPQAGGDPRCAARPTC